MTFGQRVLRKRKSIERLETGDLYVAKDFNRADLADLRGTQRGDHKLVTGRICNPAELWQGYSIANFPYTVPFCNNAPLEHYDFVRVNPSITSEDLEARVYDYIDSNGRKRNNTTYLSAVLAPHVVQASGNFKGFSFWGLPDDLEETQVNGKPALTSRFYRQQHVHHYKVIWQMNTTIDLIGHITDVALNTWISEKGEIQSATPDHTINVAKIGVGYLIRGCAKNETDTIRFLDRRHVHMYAHIHQGKQERTDIDGDATLKNLCEYLHLDILRRHHLRDLQTLDFIKKI